MTGATGNHGRGRPPTPPKTVARAGAVEQLRGGQYSRVVMLGYTAAGKRRRKRVTGPTRAWVEDEVQRLRREHREQRLTDAALLSNPTVAEHLRAWLADAKGGIGLKTWLRYRVAVERQLVPLLGRRRLRELAARPELLRGAYRTLREERGLSPASLHQVHVALRLALKQARADGLLQGDLLTDRVRPPRATARGREAASAAPSKAWALTGDEARRLLAVQSPYRLLWLTLLYTGLRAGELVVLTIDDVEPSDHGAAVRVRRALDVDDTVYAGRLVPAIKDYPKSAAGVRAIPVPPHVAEALRAQVARAAGRAPWHGYRLLFPTSRGTPYALNNLNHYLRRDAAGAAPPLVWPEWPGRALHPHVLRHTYASTLLARRRPLPEVAYLLGHSSPAITMTVYAHLIPVDLHTAAPAALAAHYGDAAAAPDAGFPESAGE